MTQLFLVQALPLWTVQQHLGPSAQHDLDSHTRNWLLLGFCALTVELVSEAGEPGEGKIGARGKQGDSGHLFPDLCPKVGTAIKQEASFGFPSYLYSICLSCSL